MSVLPTSRSRSKQHPPRTARFLSVLLVTVLLSLVLRQVPVRAVNPPVAYDAAVATDEDTPKAITLEASDVDGETLTYSILAYPVHGTLVGTPPNLVYTPSADYYGSDSLSFQANDGDQDSNIATVSINIIPVNDTPVANSQTVVTNEDTAQAIVLTAGDVDGDSLNFSIISQPAHGSLSGNPPNVTYTPNANYYGGDSFTFKANDGTLDSNTAIVSITVTPVDDAPVAYGQHVLTARSTPKAITLTASDPDGDALSFSIVTGPASGVLAGLPPNLIYTPGTGFSGSDSFTFRANDGDRNSNTATVSITVNDPPVANAQAVATDEDIPRAIVLTASDTEGDPLTYTIVAPTSHGTITGSPPNLTYTPDANYNGSDSFTFKANDGNSDSNVATVTITIRSTEDTPLAHGQLVTTAEDTPVAITLVATDGDGDPLKYTILSFPANGALGGAPPNLVYTPNGNYNGPDSFTFKANDGDQDSNTATVSISVIAVNDPPIANSQAVSTDEDTPLPILLTATDVDGDTLEYNVTDEPTHGTLSGTAPNLTYTPKPNYSGGDTFGFRANDGTANSEIAWVSIEVAPVNDPPQANEMDVLATEDASSSITLTGGDIDGDQLTFSIAIHPTDGVLTGTAPNVTYTPSQDYYGADSFTFVVRDTAGLTDTAQVSITVRNVNDNPQATSDRATIKEDSGANQINLIHNDTYLPDPYETLTIVSTTGAAHGRVAIRAGGSHVAYTPNDNYYGQDTFRYTINDGNGGSATATVIITVTNENDPPLARPDDAAMDEDDGSIEIQVLNNDTFEPDPEEDLTIVSISDAANGTVTITGGAKSLTYQPNLNFNGSDLFTYKISDRHGAYSTTIVRITVRPINDRPIAEEDHASTPEDTPVTVDVLANDVDIDLDNALNPASVRVVASPDHGTTSVNQTNGKITYDPQPDWNGVDTLTYRVCDNASPPLCDEAQVSISVGSVNDPPVSDAGADQTVDTNTRVTLDGSGSYDPDNNLPLAYRWSRISGPSVVLTDETAESPSFVAPDDPCEIVFMLRVIDYNGQGKADLTPDRVVITVNNQPPISDAGPDKIEQIDSLVTLDGTASTDPDGDLPIQYLWTQSGGPSVTLSDPTSPAPTFTAPSAASVLTFTLFVTDTFGDADTTPDQVIITISEPFYVYLPAVVGRHVIAPDLIVESLTATSRNVELVLRNQGNAPVASAFWVDVYINPTRPPATVNETFDDVGTQGLAWAVTQQGVRQLVPGGSLTLRMNDAYYDPDISVFPVNLLPGTPVYAQVDSFNPSTTYGTVLEGHEVIDEPYNNIYGPVLSLESTTSGSEMPPSADRPPAPPDLPQRD